MNDAEEDLREGDARDGDRADEVPPSPWREFIEAFLCSVGEAARVSRLMTLELRRRGLRDDLAFGDDGVLVLCPSFLGEGEEGCDEGGRAVEEAVEIERRFSAYDSEPSFLFIDGGNGAGEPFSFATGF